jgi:hypothetical protein
MAMATSVAEVPLSRRAVSRLSWDEDAQAWTDGVGFFGGVVAAWLWLSVSGSSLLRMTMFETLRGLAMAWLTLKLMSRCSTIVQMGDAMTSVVSIQDELDGMMQGIANEVGKYDLSVRWEPMGRIARVGFLIQHYEWAARMRVIEVATAFQRAHLNDFALDFDVIPYDAVIDAEFVEA